MGLFNCWANPLHTRWATSLYRENWELRLLVCTETFLALILDTFFKHGFGYIQRKSVILSLLSRQVFLYLLACQPGHGRWKIQPIHWILMKMWST